MDENRDDKLNYFSSLSDIRLMYVLKLLFGGSESYQVNYNLYTYENTEILTETEISNFGYNHYDSTITLLTPRDYRSFNITIFSDNNELTQNDVIDILSSFESTLEKLDE